MARKIIISDIHGMAKMLKHLLIRIEYNPFKDRLYLLGDYVDRGKESKEVIKHLIKLKETAKENLVVLQGNHDEWFYRFLTGEMTIEELYDWLKYGGILTLDSYCGKHFVLRHNQDTIREKILTDYPGHVDFLKSLLYYHEDDEHIYVHAGVNPFLKDWRNTSCNDMIWIREPFLDQHIPSEVRDGRKIVFGHTPTVHLHGHEDIWFSPFGDKIGIDGGAGQEMQMNALIVEEGEYKFEYVTHHETYTSY